jgi:hypothetical protein
MVTPIRIRVGGGEHVTGDGRRRTLTKRVTYRNIGNSLEKCHLKIFTRQYSSHVNRKPKVCGHEDFSFLLQSCHKF